MLDEDEIASLVRSQIARSSGSLDSVMEAERTKARLLYDGLLPQPINSKNSKYVSLDVQDSVDSMEAQLIETFCGAFQPVKFMPQGANDMEQSRIDTEACNWVAMRQNDGFGVLQDVIQDGLLGRMGVAKVWWEANENQEELDWEDGDDDSMQSLSSLMANNPDAQAHNVQLNEMGQPTKAKIVSKSDTSQVRIMAIPSEEFGISKGAVSVEDADLVFHRQSLTRAEAINRWPDKEECINEVGMGTDWINDREKSVRTQNVDDSFWADGDEEQFSGQRIEVFECYAKFDENEDADNRTPERKLWKVVMAGGEILEREQVKRVPFLIWVPLRRSHTIWGSNYALRVESTQNARTALTRGILDHTVITTNPRWMIARGGLQNPNELMDGRIGGLVTVRDTATSIAPLPSAPLNPFVFQTLGMLGDNKEAITGISRLSQGLNKDALSNQNSGDMVDQLINTSMTRQKVIARRFAEHFLAPMYLMVLQLLVENAKKEFFIEVAGNWQPVNPSAMSIRKHVVIDFNLGPGEQDKEAAKLKAIYQGLDGTTKEDPAMAPSFGPKQKFNLLSRILVKSGEKDVSSILADPATLPAPQPNPMQQATLAKEQATATQLNAQAQATTAKIQREEQRDQMAHELEMAKQQLELQKITAQLQLDVRKQAHTEALDAAEMRLAVENQANAKVTEFLSPK